MKAPAFPWGNRAGRTFCLLLAALLFAQSVCAGRLEDFEKDATKQKPEQREPEARNPQSSSSSSADSSPDSPASLLGELLLLPIVMMVQGGGRESLDRANGKGTARQPGEAVIPLLRLDVGYQKVEHDVQAVDVRGEAGFGPFGVQARHTRFWERGSNDPLSATQAHALFRMSLGSKVEWDWGLGALVLDGARTTSGFSFTAPFLVHPSKHFGVEFRPSWSDLNGNAVQDYDLSILVGGPSLSLKLGYRWFLSEHSSLNGPQAGISLRW